MLNYFFRGEGMGVGKSTKIGYNIGKTQCKTKGKYSDWGRGANTLLATLDLPLGPDSLIFWLRLRVNRFSSFNFSVVAKI